MGGWRSSAASPQALCFWGLAPLDHQPPAVHFFPQSDFAVLLVHVMDGLPSGAMSATIAYHAEPDRQNRALRRH